MRYREGEMPDSTAPFGETMHDMLSLTMVLAVAAGIALLLLGLRGRILWLKVWSLGLIGCSLLYLILDALGFRS